jgi:hypothetical protein
MAAPRLYFLYPSFSRAAGAVELGPIRTSVRQRPARPNAAQYSAAARRNAEALPQRYGNAKEPPPHLLGEVRAGRSTTTDRPPRPDHEGPADHPAPTPAEEKPSTSEATAEKPKQEGRPIDQEPASVFSSPIDQPPPELRSPQPNPIETVLSMPSPAEEAEEDKPPHLQTPRYVHHFDTYGLVQDLTKGGFTQNQSTALMKAVRAILSDNMDLARRGLVSKSNVENETYLFRAACSELKTEVQNNRKVEADKQRTQRAHLQHEVDILNQKVGQDASSLKDELKGMFDDRKMAVRMESRNMESKVWRAPFSRIERVLIRETHRFKSSTTRSQLL